MVKDYQINKQQRELLTYLLDDLPAKVPELISMSEGIEGSELVVHVYPPCSDSAIARELFELFLVDFGISGFQISRFSRSGDPSLLIRIGIAISPF